ncbi:MAG: hypothetical protein KAZ98_00820 [Prevotella sp.]|nr:hypothetical protein [Prevotella sp.]
MQTYEKIRDFGIRLVCKQSLSGEGLKIETLHWLAGQAGIDLRELAKEGGLAK